MAGKKQDPIHINPKNKGKFTEEAKRHGRTVQQEAAADLAPGSSATPAERKRANFARNAANWKR